MPTLLGYLILECALGLGCIDLDYYPWRLLQGRHVDPKPQLPNDEKQVYRLNLRSGHLSFTELFRVLQEIETLLVEASSGNHHCRMVLSKGNWGVIKKW